jgi:hypothetical protein
MGSRNQIKNNSYVDENIACATIQMEANMSNLHWREKKEMTKPFHIKIHVKKTKVVALFDSSS